MNRNFDIQTREKLMLARLRDFNRQKSGKKTQLFWKEDFAILSFNMAQNIKKGKRHCFYNVDVT